MLFNNEYRVIKIKIVQWYIKCLINYNHVAGKLSLVEHLVFYYWNILRNSIMNNLARSLY